MPSTSALTIVSPMPVPSIPSRSAPARLKGSNASACCSRVMPMPSSETRMRTCPASGDTSRWTLPPGRLYLIALVSRFTSTCFRRVASARTYSALAGATTVTPCCCARPSTSGRLCSMTVANNTGCSTTSRAGPSSRDSSSTLLISVSRCSPAEWMCSRRARRLAAPSGLSSGAPSSASSSCVKPSTAFIGVRSSWLMRASSSDLAWLSRNTSARSWRAAAAACASVMSQFTPSRIRVRPRSSRTGSERDASQRCAPSARTMRNS